MVGLKNKIKKLFKAKYLLLFFISTLFVLKFSTPFCSAAITVTDASHHTIEQGETEGLVIIVELSQAIKGSSTYYASPYSGPQAFFSPIDGQAGGIEVVSVGSTIDANAPSPFVDITVKTSDRVGIGKYKLKLYCRGVTDGDVTVSSSAFYLQSKPVIENISPLSTYVGASSVTVTIDGYNFYDAVDDLDTSIKASILGGNKTWECDFSLGENAVQTSISSTVVTFANAVAGGPYVVKAENQRDGGVGYSKDYEGKDKPLFLIYPKPHIDDILITDVEDSLFQGQVSGQILIRGNGFHSQSLVVTGTSTACAYSGGLDIINTQVDDAGKLITLSVNVNNNARTGTRYFKVLNPDGNIGSGTSSKNSTDGTDSITNCITKKLMPDSLTLSPASLTAGDEKEISITASGDGYGFSSDVTVLGLGGITVTNVVYTSSWTIGVYVTADAKAGKYGQQGLLVFNNVKYKTQSSTSIVINRPDPIDFTVTSGSNVYQGLISTVTISGNFGDDSVPSVSGEGITLDSYAIDASTPYARPGADNSLMYLYVKVNPTAIPGPRTITVENKTYDETKSVASLNVLQVPIPEIVNTSSLDIRKGEIEIVDLYVKNLAPTYDVTLIGDKLTLLASARNGSLIPPYDINGSTLTLYIEVDPSAASGDRGVTITNTDFVTSVSSSVIFNIIDSPYSDFSITSISPDSIVQGETKVIQLETEGSFERAITATVGNTNIKVNNTIWVSSQEVHLELKVDPKTSTGTANIVLTNPSYNASASTNIIVNVSEFGVPIINNVSVAGASGNIIYPGDNVDVLIEGTGFATDATFNISGSGITIESQNIIFSTKAVVNIKVTEEVTISNRAITITNTDYNKSYTKDEALSLIDTFKISGVAPIVLAAGTSSYFYINGSGFKNDGTEFKVYVDDILVPNTILGNHDKIIFLSSRCVSQTQISCEVYVGTNIVNGNHDISVYFDAIGTTVAKQGIINIPKKPEVYEVKSTLSQGDAGKEITIVGRNFEVGATVVISGSGILVSTHTVIPPNLIKITCDITNTAEKGPRILKVINPTGETGDGEIKVIAPPKVTSCFPSTVLKGATRYLEITGADFSSNVKVSFSGGINENPDITDETKVNLRRIETGETVGVAGSTQLFLFVYIGTNVVSGHHDIIVTNYKSDNLVEEEAKGEGSGILNIRTPLRIDNEVGSIRIPQGKDSRFVTIEGDGFSEATEFKISGGEVEVLRKIYEGERSVTLELKVLNNALLGLKMLNITEPTDDSSAYKQIINIIEPVSITDVQPKSFGIGLVHATMTITGNGIDIDTTTVTNRRFGLYNGSQEVYGYDVVGLDVEDQIEIIGGGVDNVVIDTTTLTDNSVRLYFTVLTTATPGYRSIRITNKNREEDNTVLYEGAFNIEEIVEVDVVSPNYKQVNSSGIITIRGTGFDPLNDYSTDGSTITFSGQGVHLLSVSYPNISQSLGLNDYSLIIGTFNVADFSSGIIDKIRDVTVRNKNGTIGTVKGAMVLTETLSINESLVSPTTIAMQAENVVVNVKGAGIMEGCTAYFWRGSADDKILNEVITNKIEFIDDDEINVHVRTAFVQNGQRYNLRVQNPNSLYWDSSEQGSGSIITVDNRPAINSMTPNKIRIGASVDVVVNGYGFRNYPLKDDEGTIKAISFGKAGVHVDYELVDVGDEQFTGRVRIIPQEGIVHGAASLYMYTNVDGVFGVGKNILEVLPAPSIDTVIPREFNAEKEFTLFLEGGGFDPGVDIAITKSGTDNSDDVIIWKGDDNDIRESETRVKIESVLINKAGTYDIKIFNTDGSNIIKENALTIYPPKEQAIITSLNPAYATQGAQEVKIDVEGLSFLPNMSMYFDGSGVTISSMSIYSSEPSSATIILNVAEDATPGPRNIVAANPGAEVEKKIFHIAAAPTVTEILPQSIQKGVSTEIRILGEGFIEKGTEGEEISVTISGQGITVYKDSTTFVSSRQINTYVSVADDDNTDAGLRDVRVINPFGLKGEGAGLLNIVEPIKVISVTPAKLSRGDKDRNIVINGSGFEEGATVAFTGNGINVSNVLGSGNQLSAIVTVSKDADLTSRGVIVTNLNETSASVNNILSIGPEVIVSIANPSIVGRGARGINNEGIEVVISGSNFNPSSNTVTISGSGIIVKETETYGKNSVVAKLVIGDNAILGPRNITVTTVEGSSGEGEGILIIEDSVNISRVEPQVIVMYKDAFKIYNSSLGLTSAEYKIEGDTLTLREDNIVTNEYYLADTSYDTVEELVNVINSVGNGWSAELIDFANKLKQEKTVYLNETFLTDVLKSSNTNTVKFKYNEQNLTVYGRGFDVLNSGVEILASGTGIIVSSPTVTSSVELHANALLDVLNISWGSRDLKVINPDGTLGDGIGMLNVVEPLSITTCSPVAVGVGAENALIKIKGKGFASGIRAEIKEPSNGVVLNSGVEYLSTNELNVRVTIPKPFTFSRSTITLINVNGDTKDCYLDIEDIPVVISIDPTRARQTAGGLTSTMTITIDGYGFDDVLASSNVAFSGNGIDVITVSTSTYGSYDRLLLGIKVERLADTTKRDLSLIDGNGNIGTANEVLEILPAPSITSIPPSNLLPGTTGTLEVNGTGFDYGCNIDFLSAEVEVLDYNYINSTKFVVRIYVSSTAFPAAYDVRVENPDKSYGDALGLFTISEPPKEVDIQAVSPSLMANGVSNQNIIISGLNFDQSAQISFDGTGITVSSNVYIGGIIRAEISIADTDSAIGVHQLRVTNPSGKSDTIDFEVVKEPDVTSISLSNIEHGREALVYLTGSGFIEGSSVTISATKDITISSVQVMGITQLQFLINVGSSAITGAHDITVTNRNGDGIGKGILVISAALDVISASPSSFAQDSRGRTIWLRGTGFKTDTQVDIAGGGIEIKETSYVNETEIKLVIDVDVSASLGDREITLVNSNGRIIQKTGIFSVIPPIRVTEVVPKEVGLGINETIVNINGSQFEESSVVSFSGVGIDVLETYYYSSNQLAVKIKVTDDANTGLGTRSITVSNGDNYKGTGTNLLEVKELIDITLITPNYIFLQDNTTYYDNIIVRGDGINLLTVPTISFSGTGLTVATNSASILGDGGISFKLWIDTTVVVNNGVRDIIVQNGDGTIGRGRGLFSITDPLEIVYSIPNSLGKGASNEKLSIYGKGFVNSSEVEFNDGVGGVSNKINVLETEYISSERLDVTLNISSSVTLGYATFTVTNVGIIPQVSTKTYSVFEITNAPVVYGVTPDRYAQGARNQSITILGSGFTVGNSTITLGNGIIVKSVSITETEINAVIDVDKSAEIAYRDVTVLSNGKYGRGKELFRVLEAPSVTSINPSEVRIGTENKEIEIIGSNFSSGAEVLVDAVGVTTNSVTYIGTGKILLNISVSSGSVVAGDYNIEVVNPDKSVGVGVDLLSIKEIPIPPTVLGISPDRAHEGSGQQSIVFTGTNFNANISVTFDGGGITVDSTTYISSTQILVKATIADNALPGPRNIIVTNTDGGTSIVQSGFEITTTPIVTSVSPSSVERGGTDLKVLAIEGSGFLEGAEVQISGGGVYVSSVSYMGTTKLVAYVVALDTAPTWERDITVVNPHGLPGRGAGILDIVAPLEVTSINPFELTLGEINRTIIVQGSGFEEQQAGEDAIEAKFSGVGISVTNIEYYNENQIKVTVSISNDQNTLGWHNITVVNPNGIEATKNNALYIGYPVEVLSANPSVVGRGATNKQVVITGKNFTAVDGSNTVTIDGTGVIVNSVYATGEESITMNITVDKNANLGTRNITIANKNGSQGLGLGLLEIDSLIKISNVNPNYIETTKDNCVVISSDITTIFEIYLNDPFGGIPNTGYKIFVYESSMTLSVPDGDGAGDKTFDLTNTRYDTLEELRAEIGWLSGEAGAGNNGWTVNWKSGASVNSLKKSSLLQEGTIDDSGGYISPGASNAVDLAMVENYKYGKDIVIRGSGFSVGLNSATVEISGAGVVCTSTTVNSSVEIIATIQIDDENVGLGARDLIITNPDGTYGRSNGILHFIKPIRISQVAPTIVGNSNGASNEIIEVIGEGFVQGISVESQSSGLVVNDVIYDNNEKIRVEVSASSIGDKILKFRNPTSLNYLERTVVVESLPVVSTVEPSSLPQGAGGGSNSVELTFTGEGFDVFTSSLPLEIVKFSDSNIFVSSVSYVSGDYKTLKIKVTVDKGADIGSKDIIITDRFNNTYISRDIFNITAAPNIVSVNPSTLVPGTTVSMTIRGGGFTSSSRMWFESVGISTTTFNFVSNDHIVVDVIAYNRVGIAGLYDLKVINTDYSEAVGYNILTVLDPPQVPILTEISPSELAKAQLEQDIIIRGENFETGAIVNISGGGINITSTTVVSSTQIRIRVSVNETADEGYRAVSVTNASGHLSNTLLDKFRIKSLPSVTQMIPSSITRGATGYMTLKGTGFGESIEELRISNATGIDVNSVQVIGDSELTFSVKVGTHAFTGNHDIWIITKSGSGRGTGIFGVIVPVEINNISPGFIAKGSTSRNFSITGQGFSDIKTVQITGGGISVSNLSITENEITGLLSANIDAELGEREIVLINENNTEYSKSGIFNVKERITVDSVEPNILAVGLSSKTIAINGTGFELINGSTPTVEISGGGVQVLSTQFNGNSQIIATVKIDDSAAITAREVKVVNADANYGTGSNVVTISNLVTIGSTNPSYKEINDDTTFFVKIIGQGFDVIANTPTVTVSGNGITVLEAYSPTSSSEMQIKLEIDTMTITTGSRDITIRNEDGSLGIGKAVFDITEQLSVERAVPSELGKGLKNGEIYVYGQGFTRDMQITVNNNISIKNTGNYYIASDQLKLELDLSDSNVKPFTQETTTFTFRNIGGEPIYFANFKVTDAPAVNSVTDNTKEFAQGATNQTVTIEGKNFVVDNTTVTFSRGGIRVISTQVDSSSSIITVVVNIDEDALLGARDIIVEADSKTGIGSGLFTVLSKPVISSISPSSLIQGVQNQILEISGVGFGSGGSVNVYFDPVGITTNSVTLVNSNLIKVNVAVSSTTTPTGTYDVTVENADGSIGTAVDKFNVLAKPLNPVIYSMAPSILNQGVGSKDLGGSTGIIGQEITIQGENFNPEAVVSFTGDKITITSTSWKNQGNLSVRVVIEEDATPGYRSIIVVNPDGGEYKKDEAFQIVSTPKITSIDPGSIAKNLSGTKIVQDVSIIGDGFLPNATVEISGDGVGVSSTTYLGKTEIQFNLTLYDTATPGSRDIIVTNPHGASAQGAGILKIVKPMSIDSSGPSLPITIPRGTLNRVITITGSGFKEDAQVSIGEGVSVVDTEFVNSGELVVTVNVLSDASLDELRVVTVRNVGDGTEVLSTQGVIQIVPELVISGVEKNILGIGAQNQTLIIRGSGFRENATVAISGVGVSVSSYTTFVGETELHFNVLSVAEDANLGFRAITITNSDGESKTEVDLLEIKETVTITEIDPSYMIQDTSTTVRIIGTGFDLINGSTPSIYLSGSGVTISSITYVGDNYLTAIFNVESDAIIGSRDIRVVNSDGALGKEESIYEVGKKLEVSSVAPASLGKGSVNEIVTVSGEGFVNGCEVVFLNDKITVNDTKYRSSEELDVYLDIASDATEGLVNIRVENPNGDTKTLSTAFTVNAQPVITKVSPLSYAKGAVDQEVIITGYNFDSNIKSISFGEIGIRVSTFTVVGSSITAMISIDNSVEPEKKDIIIIKQDNSFGTGKGVFTVTPAPIIESVEPIAIDQGTDDVEITLYGTGFQAGLGVLFNDEDFVIKNNGITYHTDKRISVRVDVSSVSIGSYNIGITNPDGSSALRHNVFSIVTPPKIISCVPNQINQGTVNQEIVISGTNFDKRASVAITGGTPINISTVNVVSGSQIKIVIDVPSTDEAIGPRNITVTNPNNSSTGNTGENKLVITPVPIISSFDPPAMTQNTTSWIVLTGKGFYEGIAPNKVTPKVWFSGSGVTVQEVRYTASTQMNLLVEVTENADIGFRDVFVENADGTNGFGTDKFKVVAPIKITSITPEGVPQGAQNRSVSIKGQGFAEKVDVTISGGDVTVKDVIRVSPGEITFKVDVLSTAQIDDREVIVTNVDEKTSYKVSGQFFVIEPINISSVDPISIGRGIKNKKVFINGSGFEDGAEVEISGIGLTVSTVSYSNTQIVLSVDVSDDAPLQKRDIKVTNSDENSGEKTELLEVISAVNVDVIDPAYIVRDTSTWVTIRGNGFEEAIITGSTPTVAISGTGVDIGTVTVNGTTELQVYFIVHSTANVSSRDITIRNSNGTLGIGNGIFKVVPELDIVRVTPSTLGAGAENESLIIEGNGFIDGVAVSFNHPGIQIIPGSIEYKSSEQINLKVNTTVIGISTVTVRNPNGVEKSKANAFEVTLSPVLKSISPSNQIAQGASDQVLTITGANFDTNGMKVDITGEDITISTTIVSSAGSAQITLSVDDGASLTSRDIYMTNENGFTGIGRSALTVIEGPRITSVGPNEIDQGTSGLDLVINGSGFKEGLVLEVELGGTKVSGITINSIISVLPNRISANITVDRNVAEGTYDIVVTNPDNSFVKKDSALTITPPPSVTVISPSNLERGMISKNINVIGSNFKDGAVVDIDGGGITVNKVTFVSVTKLIINLTVSDTALVGERNITVTNPNGSIGIGQGLIKIATDDSILSNIRATSYTIDYELRNNQGLPEGTTIQYQISGPVQRVVFSVKNSKEEEVKTLTLYDVPLGNHTTNYVFFWNGLIVTDRETGEKGKINGVYSVDVSIYTSENTLFTRKLDGDIKVDVVNIYNTDIEYTEIGENKEKVSPYTIIYNISKSAYADISVYDESGTVVRKFVKELSKQGTNRRIWDGRNSEGKRVSIGVYTAKIMAYDDSNPRDYAQTKEVKISVNQLKLVDVKATSIKTSEEKSQLSLIASETMLLTINIYKPGTTFDDDGEPSQQGKRVKTLSTFLNGGTTFYFEWDGRNENGDILVDGDYIFVINGEDSYGNKLGEPAIGEISIARAGTLEERQKMFKENSYPYPNPVRPNQMDHVKIRYAINKASDLKIQVFDLMGDLVYEKIELGLTTGEGYVKWDLTNQYSKKVARGVYIYVLEAFELGSNNRLRAINKVMVIK